MKDPNKNYIEFQKLKNWPNLKIAATLLIPSSVFFMLFFMNCSSVDSPIEKGSETGNNTTSPTTPTTQTYFTNSNPIETPILSGNGGSNSNITWLHTDVSAWNITSEISNVEIKDNGEVCIYHSQSGQWQAETNVESGVTEAVEGNAWIIVPIRDSYYAATYDYLREGEPCHMLDVGSIANLYDSDKSLGKRTDKEPLKSWIALGGDTIYFMVSGLARNDKRNDKRNVQERSDFIKVTLPSSDGENPIIIHQSCSEDPTGPHCPGQCNVPNRSDIVRQIATDNPNQLQEGHLLNLDRANGGPKSQSSSDSRWAFMDEVVKTLNGIDSRWGYTCIRGDCDDISTDAIAYLCSDSDTGTIPVDIINADGTVQWSVHADDPGGARWKFPRPGSSDPGEVNRITVNNDVSDFSWDKVRWLNSHDVNGWSETSQITSVQVKQNGQVCIDHNKKGQWPPATPLGGDTLLEGNPYIIVKIGDTYYAATYEWLRPGQVCKLGHAGPLSVTYSGNDSIGAHTKRSPLQTWAPTGGEVVGFMVSGLARNQVTPNARERSNIVWYTLPSVDGSIQGGTVGTFSGGGSGGGDMGPTPNRFDIVQQVAEATADLFRTDPSLFTQRVAECLKLTDNRWGRRRNDSGTLSFDVVAYQASNSNIPYSVDIITGARGDNPKLNWGAHGQVGGSWESVTGSCILGDSLAVPCTQEQVADGFLTIENQCVPLCVRLAFYSGNPQTPKGNISEEYYTLFGNILKNVEIAENDNCDPENDNNKNYNILPITIKTASSTRCCRRTKKNDCSALSPHHKLKKVGDEQNCYPSCGQAAKLAGYESNHYLSDINTSCSALNNSAHDGHTDWKDLPEFYDPYVFKKRNKDSVYETGNCCARGEPSNTPALEHNEDGTYDVVAGVPVSSTTTTTSSSSSPTSSTPTTSITVNTNNCGTDCVQYCTNQMYAIGYCLNGQCRCEGQINP